MQRVIKPLLRRPAMPIMLMLQVAIACAIACNALSLLEQKLEPLLTPTAVTAPERLLVVTNLYARGKPWNAVRLRGVGSQLAALPGVADVSYAASLPMLGSGRIAAKYHRPGHHDSVKTSIYLGNRLIRTLGLQLVAGRAFNTSERALNIGSGMGFAHGGAAIITRALAKRLFPDGHALGQTLVYSAKAPPRTIVGIVAHLMRNTDLGQGNAANMEYSMLIPGVAKRWPKPRFVLRLAPGANATVRKAVHHLLRRTLGSRMLPGYTPKLVNFSTLRHRMLAPERSAAWLFAAVTLIVLIVTVSGIGGMTGYWVRQRTRQIGVRRALGARRSDILCAFQYENFIVILAGVVLGMFATYGVDLWLMHHYAMKSLAWYWLPLGAALLLALGQCAALVAARRAARIAPALASRAL